MKKALLVVAVCAGFWAAATYGSLWTDWVRPALAAGYTAVCGPPGTSQEANCIKPNSDGTVSTSTNLSQVGGAAVAIPGGGVASGTVPVALDPASPGITAPGQTTKSASLPVTIASDQGALGSVTVTSGTVGLAAATTGGGTPYTFVTTASTNSQSIKSSAAGTLVDVQAFNTTTTISYLRLYDSAGAPTCSSATNFINSYPIPPASASGGVGGFSISLGAVGKAFANGIGFCVTGGGSSTDNSNAQANIYINADYK